MKRELELDSLSNGQLLRLPIIRVSQLSQTSGRLAFCSLNWSPTGEFRILVRHFSLFCHGGRFSIFDCDLFRPQRAQKFASN